MELDTLRDEARDLLDGMVELRRKLHEWPEIGNELPITRENVLAALDGLPLDITLHETTSGIAAILDGGKPGPTVLLRGDMDALPMTEDTGLDFTSKSEGRCTPVATTRTPRCSSARRGCSAPTGRHRRAGAVHVPARRGGQRRCEVHARGGPARLCPRAPTARTSPVTGAFAMHITSSLPTGFVSSRGARSWPRPTAVDHRDRPRRPRQRAASCARSDPRRLRDRPGAADDGHPAHRRVRPRRRHRRPDHRRHVNNVIPETAEIEGTIRAVSERTRRAVHDGIRRVAEGIAAAHDAEVTVSSTTATR